MSIRTIVTLHCVDGKNTKTRFSYESLVENPTDGNIQSLVSAFKAISKLGIERVTVTRPVSAIAAVAADDIYARVGDTAILTCHKGEAFGGLYSFQFAAVKDALVKSDGSLDYENAAFSSWCEWFDDGSACLVCKARSRFLTVNSWPKMGQPPRSPRVHPKVWFLNRQAAVILAKKKGGQVAPLLVFIWLLPSNETTTLFLIYAILSPSVKKNVSCCASMKTPTTLF